VVLPIESRAPNIFCRWNVMPFLT